MTEEQKGKVAKGFGIAGTVLTGVGGIVSGIFGGGASAASGASDAASALLSGAGIPVNVGVEDKSRKTLIWVAVGVGAVILIAAIFGFAGRRRR